VSAAPATRLPRLGLVQLGGSVLLFGVAWPGRQR
jgi:hypothetical protein